MDNEADNLDLLVELLDITVALSRAIEIDGAGNPNLLREVLDFAEVLDTMRKIAIVKEAAARHPLKGVLLIDGKSIEEIVEGHQYSDEELKSLAKHIKTKRPHLAKALDSAGPAMTELLKNGDVDRHNVDFDAICKQIPEALKADRVEAALDSSIWATMEWKWIVFQE